MNSVLYDLQAAETHLSDLQAEARNERLVKAALKLRREQSPRSRLSRYLAALRGRNPDGPPIDPKQN